MPGLADVVEPATGSSGELLALLLLFMLSLGAMMLVGYLMCTGADTKKRIGAAIRTVRDLPSQRAIAATTCRLCGKREATTAGRPCDGCLHEFRSELDRWGHEQDTA
ncbi:MAG: hypothetical protein WCG47_01650 [Dermatophilaceae bacterium]